MKKCILASSLILISVTSWATVTSCDDVKSKIEKKLAGKNVTNYSLEVAAKGTETKNRIVGSCEGDKKIIIYHRTSAKKKMAE